LNLTLVKSYNQFITKFTVVLVALNPITKYPLAIAPVTLQLEELLRPVFRSLSRGFACCFISILLLIVCITVPGFHNVMALLGSFFSFMVSIIFPEICYLVMFGRKLTFFEKVCEVGIILIGVVCMCSGTVWAFLPDGNAK
jgi:vesicular inhibitory amino acid transporter